MSKKITGTAVPATDDAIGRAVKATSRMYSGNLLRSAFVIPPQIEALGKAMEPLNKIANSIEPLTKHLGTAACTAQFLNSGIEISQSILSQLETARATVGRLTFSKEVCEALEKSDHEAFSRLKQDDKFDLSMMAHVVHLMSMEAQERAEALRGQLSESEQAFSRAMAEKKEREAALKKIHDGPSQRSDAKDKAAFIKWVTDKQLIIANIAELLDTVWDDWPLQNSYGNDTLKAWYREGMPAVKLKGGRPLSKKRSKK